jgi:KipI family sensor histidine kinase inhibitor
VVPRPRISAVGDSALLVTFGERIDAQLNSLAHELTRRLRAAAQAGANWQAPIPAYASVLVRFDPLLTTPSKAQATLAELADEVVVMTPPVGPGDVIEIPIRYGGENGPDLADVAGATGLTPAEVVRRHTSTLYRAYFLGFAPGFAYLGRVPAELRLPRRATPRQRVPAGSVAIAGEQTAVYPLATAGGWHLLGRTDLVLWDVERNPPALIAPGAAVRFVAVDG